MGFIKSWLQAVKWFFGDRLLEDYSYANHKKKMIKDSFQKIKAWGISGSYMEFGTFRGQSVAYAFHEKSKLFINLPGQGKSGISHIYAFDSFAGIGGISEEELPGPFVEGSYSSTAEEYFTFLSKRGVDISDITTIPGFFQESLTESLQDRILLECPVAAVVNIDCDIYEPALLALHFIAPMLRQGSVVLFDDWYSYALAPNKGEVRALNEFLLENSRFSFHPWKDYGPVGRSFIVGLR